MNWDDPEVRNAIAEVIKNIQRDFEPPFRRSVGPIKEIKADWQNLQCEIDNDGFFTFEYKEPRPVAKVGDPSFAGAWQPTGDKFEIMFNMSDIVGVFYIREREQ